MFSNGNKCSEETSIDISFHRKILAFVMIERKEICFTYVVQTGQLLKKDNKMNQSELIPFTIAAIALLGSPGPAIAALLAVGRTGGWKGSLPFFGGLQLGLATAAGLTTVGLFAALSAFPQALIIMSFVATGYLLYLAYKIATSPVGQKQDIARPSQSSPAGFLLGVTNPKAYLAFASLFASFQISATSAALDSAAKWMGVVFVMIVVDIIWLWIGVRLGRLAMSELAERVMNYLLAASIVLATGLALL